MAIIKDFLTGQGVTAEYHKIRRVTFDCKALQVEAEIEVYTTPEARDAGYGFLWMGRQYVPFDAFTQDPRDMFYPMLVAYKDSYLVGGGPDPSLEGFTSPGNTSITLKPDEIAVSPPEPTEP